MVLAWFTPEDQRYSPVSFLFRLILPGAIAFAFFLLCFLIVPRESAMILGGLMILYYVPPAGKESIIPLGIALGIPWWLMAAALALLDVLTGLFMILNFGIALRFPYLGPWISRFIASGNDFMRDRPWLARWRTLGVAFFVFLPFQGTGGVGATVVGMMVGLSPGMILLAIAIGGSAECLMFALGSELIWNLILTNVYLGVGVACLVILAAIIMLLLFRKMGRKSVSADK
ncbi:putative membrane protein [Methanolinea mesophila]|uniref:small multi-drug export protein n=1 Tax=Methanolinea mesophila TaxID=547055 RepID=UPI001AE60ACF|nr:small multi-drug export protein [Methanolinea mesophila]MBP1929189.1 putative membrane protein [Methanolinea mesophila]